MARQWNGAYCQSLSAVARARYESKVLQAGLGIVSYSIDYLTPAVLYFARNRQMVQERTLHTLAGGRKELYMSDRIKHPTTQQVLLDRRAKLSLRFAPNVKFYTYKIASSHDITRSMQPLYICFSMFLRIYTYMLCFVTQSG